MKRRENMIAVLLCITLLASGCAASSTSDAKEENTTEQGQEKDSVSKEKEYQQSLNLIEPRAYDNVSGLNLEKGAYLSIIGKSATGEYWDAVKAGAEQAVADMNDNLGYEGSDRIKVTYSGPSTADSVDEQVNILDEELARYPAAVGIAIVDDKACGVQFDLAAESDIPVVAFDSGSDYQGLMATVSTNNQAAAQMAADKLAESIEGAGEVVVIANDSKSQASKGRVHGFVDRMTTEHTGISVVETYYRDDMGQMQTRIADEINAGSYSRDGVEEAVGEVVPEDISEEDIIDYIFVKHPNVKGCYASNAGTLESALGGLKRQKLEGVSVVAYDASKAEIQALADGKVTGLIVQNPFGMGYATVVAAARASLDLGNEAVVDTGYTWVTADNVEDKNIQKILY